MKKYKKIIYISVIAITIALFIIPNQIQAATRCSKCGGDGKYGGGIVCEVCNGAGIIADKESTHSAGEIISEAEQFIETGEKDANNKIEPAKLKDMSDTLYNILLVIGIIVAVVVGLIMGIKFIIGSIEEKAEIKSMIIPYIIGCVIIFGAFTIWKIVVDILQFM